MEKKTTAVEWLTKKVQLLIHESHHLELVEYYEKALEMERRQMAIPWQLCPKCLGDGNLARHNLLPYIGSSSTCDVCHGKKIIPMYDPNGSKV